MMLFLGSRELTWLCPLPEPLIRAALPIFLEQWFPQIITDTLWGRLAGSQVDAVGMQRRILAAAQKVDLQAT